LQTIEGGLQTVYGGLQTIDGNGSSHGIALTGLAATAIRTPPESQLATAALAFIGSSQNTHSNPAPSAAATNDCVRNV